MFVMMRHRFFLMLSAISLVLCAATYTLWVTTNHGTLLYARTGGSLRFARIDGSNIAVRSWDNWPGRGGFGFYGEDSP